MAAITIEGASPLEQRSTDPNEDVFIDVAEYYGTEEIRTATKVRYVQLKHSTVRQAKPWTAREIGETLKAFANKLATLEESHGEEFLEKRFQFSFVSNRPIDLALREAIEASANGLTPPDPKVVAILQEVTGRADEALSRFCRMLCLEGGQDNYWVQRHILQQDVKGYLPDADVDAPTQLKELVTRKALSESASNPTITRVDVLRVLKTDEAQLFPAPNLLTHIKNAIPRDRETEIVAEIIASLGPFIVHAAGGLGKSVLAERIGAALPSGSRSIVYDCFANGAYRNISAARHRHKEATVQMANELAAQGLCHPLIPTPAADAKAYTLAFLHRLDQSISSIRGETPDALLCIVVDAADNAQMAADEFGEGRSFIRDLLRENLPDGVRLIALCRSHRQGLLDPLANVKRLELGPFNRDETAAHLRQAYPSATEADVTEFHSLTSQNPRVQALAIAEGGTLAEVLRRLGPNPTSVERTIERLLDDSVAKLRHNVGPVGKEQIDIICAGMACLRPAIPISTLARMSGVDESAIKSFAFDLGRPLIVIGESLQFLDEPAETWFRERFKPDVDAVNRFADSLRPLARSDAYAAASLPQLLLEGQRFPELVRLALSHEDLPETTSLQRRDVEMQRLQFALKAALRGAYYADAAKLSLKAGGVSAGDRRQRELIRTNTDFASVFLDPDRVQEMVSRRAFESTWMGSRHAYEAGFLSGKAEFAGDARSRLRMTYEWLRSWSRLTSNERNSEQIGDNDIAEIAMAELNVHGPGACARSLRAWTPREVSFRAGRLLTRRLVDRGRFGEIDELATVAGNDIGLVLAVAHELGSVLRYPPADALRRILNLLMSSRINIARTNGRDLEETVLMAVTDLVCAALRRGIANVGELAELLTRYLPATPPRGLTSRFSSSRFTLLRAYALQAELRGASLEPIDLAHVELRDRLAESANAPYDSSGEVREFTQIVGELLPWHQLWAQNFVSGISKASLASRIAAAHAASARARERIYYDRSYTVDEIARLRFEVLLASSDDDSSFKAFSEWVQELERPLFTTTLTTLARKSSMCGRAPYALDFSQRAFALVKADRADAESKIGDFILLSRAVFCSSYAESEAYFAEAVEVASKIGDENLDRWRALLDLATRVSDSETSQPELAYRLSRCAELTYAYVDRDKYFNWSGTVRAIAGLCRSSCFAIMSRWRDRGFGSWERLLPVAVSYLVSRTMMDGRLALALRPFRANWNDAKLLEGALAAESGASARRRLAAFIYGYMTLEEHSKDSWRSLKAVAGDTLSELNDIDQRIALAERADAARDKRNGYSVPGLDRKDPDRDWNAIFARADILTSEGISEAYHRFRSFDPPLDYERFFREAYASVPVGAEGGFIDALVQVSEFDLFTFRTILTLVPSSWRDRLSVKSAFARATVQIARRYCLQISRGGYYELLPFELACQVTGLSEEEISDAVIAGLSETTELFDSGRLFTLISLLVTKVTSQEARDALEFGLDLLDPLLEPTDGDGEWSAHLLPPEDLSSAVAGYIWTALAAPAVGVRWQAAHVVNALCAHGCTAELAALMRFASANRAEAFFDRRLHFYVLHARQWLLIAVARAAQDAPHLFAPYVDWLQQIAFGDAPHVLMRMFAATALRSMMDKGVIEHSAVLRDRLESVNTSPFPPLTAPRYPRDRNQEKKNQLSEDDRFFFGIDIGPYWFNPLGRVFGISQATIEQRALEIIRNDWQYRGHGRWDEDERVRRKVFREGATDHSHGSYPRADNVAFYLSYHAMMIVAGKLLQTTRVHTDPNYSRDEFAEWLSRHSLSRIDGYWIADRRDELPLERPIWKDEALDKLWRWSLKRRDFDDTLFPAPGRINLWGDWTLAFGSRVEWFHVATALVTPDKSHALLRALHTASDSSDYRIPHEGDDVEIDHSKFKMTGWVHSPDSNDGLDAKDPWAGGITFPPLKPSAFVEGAMGLQRDREARFWTQHDERVLVSKTWASGDDEDERSERERGLRLESTFDYLVSMLRHFNRDLIAKVQIDRRVTPSRYESSDSEEESTFIPPSTRVFLVRQNGSVESL